MKATDRKEWCGLVVGAVLAVSIAGLLYLAFVTKQNCVAIKDMTVQLARITHQAVAPAIAPALIEHGVIIYQAPAPTTKPVGIKSSPTGKKQIPAKPAVVKPPYKPYVSDGSTCH